MHAIFRAGIVGLTVSFSLSTLASPVVIDTDTAHIVVVRPIDLWSGDTSMLKGTLESVTDRKVSYDAVDGNGDFVRGSPTLLQGVGDNPIAQGVKSSLETLGTKLVNSNTYFFHVSKATPIPLEQFPAFERGQTEYFKRFVIAQGDPRDLEGKTSVRKFFGGVLSVGSLFLPAGKLGTGLGAQVMLNSGATEDVYNLTTETRAVLTPAILPVIDPSSYKEIDVRTVKYRPEIPGEVVIAYKVDKTPEIEQEALIRAIVTLTGADTTPEAVEAARKEDFESRVAIWDACVSAGKCQKEASNDAGK